MRYTVYFILSILSLTTGALVAFSRISGTTAIKSSTDTTQMTVADTLPSPQHQTPPMPTAADYARFAEADRAWRAKYARQYTIDELQARGDGRRTARDSVQDRVYALTQADRQAQAIAELERWLRSHPDDSELLLSLARLLTETGRNNEAIGRYRQLLALQHRGE